MRFDIEIDDRQAARALAELRRRGEGMEPALRSIGELLLNSARARFDSQTSPDGEPWTPLKPRTLARKKRNRDKILTEEGRLRGTLAYQVGDGWVEVGSPLVYGTTHQFGRGAIPARPYLGLSSEDAADVREEILDFIRGALR